MPAYIKTVTIPKPLSETEEELVVMYKTKDMPIFGKGICLISVQQDGKRLATRYDLSVKGIDDYLKLWDRVEAAILEIELG